jgi:glycosyltransferase involved in cell wall biosynthesis
MNEPKLKIAWQSNGIQTSSGYSQQSADIRLKLHKAGWTPENLCFIDMFGLSGGILKDDLGYKHYPNMNHVTGSDAMLWHGKHFNADIIITLQDVWTLNPVDLQQVPRFIPWTPVDYDTVPKGILGNLRFANRIIAMSRFGQKKLQENGFSSIYIPHHVDTKVFSPMNKQQQKINVKMNPNIFMFGMIAANKDLLPRKSFGHVFQAFKMFHDRHPNSILYIHTDPDQPGGYPIRAHAEHLGLTQSIGFPDLYKWKFDIPKAGMNQIYGTFDCLLSPSSTEGFCIPVIEAQATGTPVIVNDYTSMPELIREGITGYKTKVSDDCQHFMPIGGYMKYPNIYDLYLKMEEVFSANRQEMGVRGREWIEENYSLDKVWNERWLPFLKKLEDEIYPQNLPLTISQKTA